jgi:hypothetical protein
MTLRTSIQLAGATMLVAFLAMGCGRHTGRLPLWPLGTDPIVFQDAFTGAVEFYAFGNSKLDALSVDTAEQYAGTGCLRVTVPNYGSGYAGGAFTTPAQNPRERDLSRYNALTFWAKASRSVTLDAVGLGNDNTGGSRFEARRNAVPLTTTWTRYVIPIPLPSRLTNERGLFFFSTAAPAGGTGYVVWFDEVQFEKDAAISVRRAAMTPRTLNTFIGAALNLATTVTGTKTVFNAGETDSVVVEHMPGYFGYSSSDPAVATLENEVIQVVGAGSTTVSARLDTTLVNGALTLNAALFTPGLAPTPTVPASNVISLFSDAYPNRAVDKWSADWDQADVADLTIYGNHMKQYTNLVYAGIEFTSRANLIDASAMTHFHMDIWVPAGTVFKVKLVDFGANGTYLGELTFDSGSTPPLVTGSWVGLEIPLSSFTNLLARAHLAQLVIAGDTRTVYVDNVYFHK